MRKYHCNKHELNLLKLYDNLSNELLIIPKDTNLYNFTFRQLMLVKTKLYVYNPRVVLYIDDNPCDIIDFRQLEERLEENIFQGDLLYWHPLNFSNISQFVRFVTGT
jgi:hypothetical protein